MVDPRDDWSSPTDGPDETGGTEALYHQGMRCYRLRRWREARAHFAALKQLHPHWPDIDALLAEVDMFIRLDTLDARTPLLTDQPRTVSSPPTRRRGLLASGVCGCRTYSSQSPRSVLPGHWPRRAQRNPVLRSGSLP